MTDRKAQSAGPEERAHHADDDGTAPAGSDDWRNRRRMSARREQGAVLRLLRGDDLELVSRELGVTAAELAPVYGEWCHDGRRLDRCKAVGGAVVGCCHYQ